VTLSTWQAKSIFVFLYYVQLCSQTLGFSIYSFVSLSANRFYSPSQLSEIRVVPIAKVFAAEASARIRNLIYRSMPPRKSPFRRLSVALRFTEANMPAQVPHISTPANSLGLFLSTSKAAFLRDAKEGGSKAAGWTVVMGNEAGGTWSFKSIYCTRLYRC
jgi:hypothetical protein